MIKIGIYYDGYVVAIYNKKYINSKDLTRCMIYTFNKHKFINRVFNLGSIREQEIKIIHDDKINIIKLIFEDKGIKEILS